MTTSTMRPKVHRPVGIFERPRGTNEFLNQLQKQQQSSTSCAPALAIVPGGELCHQGSTAINDVSQTMRRSYYDYLYSCQKELTEMKQSITRPFHELGEDLGDLIADLFGEDTPVSYSEHVSEIRQKAAALGNAGHETRQTVKLGKSTNYANRISFVPKDPQFLQRSDMMVKQENPQKQLQTESVKSSSSAEEDPGAKASLVKARWLNNYKKYNRMQNHDSRGTKRLQVGKYGDVGDSQPSLSGNIVTISPQSQLT